MQVFRRAAVAAVAAILLTGAETAGAQCLGDGNGDNLVTTDELVLAVTNALSSCTTETDLERRVLRNYADLLFRNYGDAVQGAEALKAAIDDFVANPNHILFETAKAAWLAARPAYLQTEMARFYEGPIDNAETGPEGQINAWPLDEAYVDYVEGQANGGIINDPASYPDLSKETLAGSNEQGAEENVATGYHAIEFLLWGQDLRQDNNGQRPYTDYIIDGGTAANQERRGQYLKAVADLLADDLRSVRDQWDPGRAGNYRSAFLALPTKVGLGRVLTGLGTLSGFELSNERMAVALETQDQEDEHSCFSDNTHVDHRFDERGIQNAYHGRYGTLDGPGIDDLLRAVDANLESQLANQIEAAVSAIQLIPVPFDRSIQGADSAPGRQAIIASVQALRDQTDLIEDAAAALEVDITTNP